MHQLLAVTRFDTVCEFFVVDDWRYTRFYYLRYTHLIYWRYTLHTSWFTCATHDWYIRSTHDFICSHYTPFDLLELALYTIWFIDVNTWFPLWTPHTVCLIYWHRAWFVYWHRIKFSLLLMWTILFYLVLLKFLLHTIWLLILHHLLRPARYVLTYTIRNSVRRSESTSLSILIYLKTILICNRNFSPLLLQCVLLLDVFHV